jgi:hypothetical protein
MAPDSLEYQLFRLQVQSDIASTNKGDSRIYIKLSGKEQKFTFFLPLPATYKKSIIALCPNSTN